MNLFNRFYRTFGLNLLIVGAVVTCEVKLIKTQTLRRIESTRSVSVLDTDLITGPPVNCSQLIRTGGKIEFSHV